MRRWMSFEALRDSAPIKDALAQPGSRWAGQPQADIQRWLQLVSAVAQPLRACDCMASLLYSYKRR